MAPNTQNPSDEQGPAMSRAAKRALLQEGKSSQEFACDLSKAIYCGMCGPEDFADFDTPHYGVAEGFVYFISIGDPYVTHVKVGFTAGDPYKRMAALQTGCPYRLNIFGYVLGTRAMERELHCVFETARAEGEWFAMNDHIGSVIYGLLVEPA